MPTHHPSPVLTDGASERILHAIDLLGVAAQQGERCAVDILVAILTPLSQRLAGAQATRLPRGALADRETLEHDAWLGMRAAIDRWQRRGHLLAYVSVATKWHLARAGLRSQPQSLPFELLAEIPDRDLDDYLDHLQLDRANDPTGA